MKKIFSFILAALCCASQGAWANGTPAGTVISLQAQLQYSEGGVTGLSTHSNVASILVNEIVDVQLNWADASDVAVNSPDYKRVLTFRATNSGNGTQNFSLDANPNIGGGAFNPVPEAVSIYVENGAQAGLQLTGSNADTAYNSGNTISLNAGESKNIYLVYDIPANEPTNSKGYSQLKIVSALPGAATATKAGFDIPGAGAGGSDAIIGYTLARAQALGDYIVSGVLVQTSKSVIAVQDILGGTQVTSQSTLTYQITFNITGNGTAKNITMSDPVPAQETYVPGSMKLNNIPLTDATDSDAGNFTNNTLNLNLGNQIAPQNFTFTYQLKVK